MINYMQSNEQIIQSKKIIQIALWDNLTDSITNRDMTINLKFITKISNEYNIEKKNIVKSYINHIIRTCPHMVTLVFLDFVENIMHITDLNVDCMLPLTILKLNQLFNPIIANNIEKESL